jgi:hypothetical protein
MVATEVRTFVVEAPIVSLILRPIGEDTDLLIFEKDLKRRQIDPESGEVRARANKWRCRAENVSS